MTFNVLEPLVAPSETVNNCWYYHVAKAAPEPLAILWAKEIVITKRTARHLVPTHWMLNLKMSTEICSLVKSVCAAVYTIAVPHVVQFAVGIALVLGPAVEVVKGLTA